MQAHVEKDCFIQGYDRGLNIEGPGHVGDSFVTLPPNNKHHARKRIIQIVRLVTCNDLHTGRVCRSVD